MGWIDKKKLDLVMSIFRQGGDKSKLLTGGDNTGFFSRKGIAMRDAIRRGSIVEETKKGLIIQRDDVAGNRLKDKKFMGVESVKEDVKDLKEIVDYKRDLQDSLKNSPQEFFHGLPVKKSHTKTRIERAIESQIREQKFTKQSTKDFIENFGGSAEFRKWKKAFERSLQGFDN